MTNDQNSISRNEIKKKRAINPLFFINTIAKSWKTGYKSWSKY